MRAHSTAVRLVPWALMPASDHQQLVGRARLTSEHDPAKAHLGVNGQNHFRQLNLTDAVIQTARSLVTSRVFVLCGNGDKWSSSSTRSTPLRAAAATASTPAVTWPAKASKKVAALLGNDRRA